MLFGDGCRMDRMDACLGAVCCALSWCCANGGCPAEDSPLRESACRSWQLDEAAEEGGGPITSWKFNLFTVHRIRNIYGLIHRITAVIVRNQGVQGVGANRIFSSLPLVYIDRQTTRYKAQGTRQKVQAPNKPLVDRRCLHNRATTSIKRQLNS
jgi:hypothetical protein